MPVLLQEGRLLHARKACSQIQKGPFFFFNTHALHSCGAKQFYIKIKYSSPSHAFHSPTHFPSSPNPHPSHPHSTHLPFPAHSPSAPIPLTFCPQPALFLSPTHSPSVPNPLPVRPQPTLPSPLLTELVHLLPCLLLQATYSPVPSFSCPLATFPCLFSHTTCSLVYSSTCQLARYSPNLFICYPVSSRIQLVPSSPRQLVNLQCYSSNLFICYPVSSRIQLVHPSTRPLINLQCYSSNLFICYPVSSCHQRVPLSPFPLSSYPVNTIYYPLILPLYVNYFYHLTFLSVLFQNTATQILPFLSPTSTVKNVTINKPSH